MMNRKCFLLYPIAVSILLCIFAGCELEDPTEGVKSEDVVSLSFEQDGVKIQDDAETKRIDADGTDRITLIATLGEDSDPNKVVKFMTDHGSFAAIPGGKPPAEEQTFSVTASGREARAILISGVDVVDKVTVSAWVGEFADIETIEFARALPDELLVKSDKLKVKADGVDKTTIIVELFRDAGDVSNKTRVLFATTSEPESEVVVDISQRVDSTNGQVTADLKGKSENNAVVIVTATVDKDGGGELSESIEIELEGTNPEPPPTPETPEGTETTGEDAE
ncbi:hypothetical protein ACFL6S_06400 [Candidatus Poribacteria bacterium]